MQQLGYSLDAVNLRDVFEDDDSIHLVMELCEGGALLERIESHKWGGAGGGRHRGTHKVGRLPPGCSRLGAVGSQRADGKRRKERNCRGWGPGMKGCKLIGGQGKDRLSRSGRVGWARGRERGPQGG